MPVVVSKIYDNRDKHGESFVLIVLQDIQEVVVLKEAHGTISNLKMDASNASYDSLKKLRD